MSFDGASVFVTGGSRGIGRDIALRFADEGAKRVAIGYLRNDAAAEATAEELRERGAEPILVRGNVSSERVAHQVAELGPLDALVHSAATGVVRPALETEDKHWDWTLAANARAQLLGSRFCGSVVAEIADRDSLRALVGEAKRNVLPDPP
jgi:enoyl-[acyl-carrier protein] reductase III